MDDSSKQCSKCQEVKPRSEFYKNRSNKDGLGYQCKKCHNDYAESNKEKLKISRQEYYKKNKETIRARNDEYARNNVEKLRAASKKWREENKEKIAEDKKKYQEENKEKIAEYKRDYYLANLERDSEKRRVASSEYYYKNKEQARKSRARWRQSNPDKIREYTQRRRAIKKGLTVETVCYTTIRERDDTCYLCQIPFTDEERWDGTLTHVDHIIPLSRLDLHPTHSYDNCALTHARCNLSKGDKTVDEYIAIAN